MTRSNRRSVALVGASLLVAGAAGVASHLARHPQVRSTDPREISHTEAFSQLGWYYAPQREGEFLHVTYTASKLPNEDLRVSVRVEEVLAVRRLFSWVQVEAGAPLPVAFVNRAVQGDREGVPGMLHAGYATGTTLPRAWDVRGLPGEVKALVREIDRAAEVAAEQAMVSRKTTTRTKER